MQLSRRRAGRGVKWVWKICNTLGFVREEGWKNCVQALETSFGASKFERVQGGRGVLEIGFEALRHAQTECWKLMCRVPAAGFGNGAKKWRCRMRSTFGEFFYRRAGGGEGGGRSFWNFEESSAGSDTRGQFPLVRQRRAGSRTCQCQRCQDSSQSRWRQF